MFPNTSIKLEQILIFQNNSYHRTDCTNLPRLGRLHEIVLWIICLAKGLAQGKLSKMIAAVTKSNSSVSNLSKPQGMQVELGTVLMGVFLHASDGRQWKPGQAQLCSHCQAPVTFAINYLTIP